MGSNNNNGGGGANRVLITLTLAVVIGVLMWFVISNLSTDHSGILPEDINIGVNLPSTEDQAQ